MIRVRWKWRSSIKGRQSGLATLLPKDRHTFRLYRVLWDDGSIGLVRADCLVAARKTRAMITDLCDGNTARESASQSVVKEGESHAN